MDAILDLTAVRYSDFGRFLVCYSPTETVPETVKKPFPAIFGGFIPILSHIYIVNRPLAAQSLLVSPAAPLVDCFGDDSASISLSSCCTSVNRHLFHLPHVYTILTDIFPGTTELASSPTDSCSPIVADYHPSVFSHNVT